MGVRPTKFAQGGDVRSERVVVGDKVTKDWLYSYRSRAKRIELLRELIARVSEKRLEPKGARFDELVGGGGLPKGLDDVVGRLEWLNEHYRKELKELVGIQVKIEEWLEGLSQQDRDLMRVRFILGYSIAETAEMLGRSRQYVHLHEKRIFG